MKRFTFLAASLTVLFGAVPIHSAHALTLKESLVLAYKHNPLLRSERANLRATDETASQAFSGWLPTATFTHERGKENSKIGNAPQNSFITETRTFQLVQPLFKGGATVASMKRSKAVIAAGQQALLETEQQVLLQSVTAYMDVFRDKKVTEISKNNENVLQEHLDATKERFDLGEVTRTDVAQAQARVSRAITDRILAEGNLEASRATFKRVIGEDASDLSYPEILPEIPENIGQVLEMALATNPTLKQTEHSYQAAARDVQTLNAALLPTVSFNIVSRRDEGNVTFQGSNFDTDTFTFNTQIPLYQSGSEYSRIRQSKHAKQQRHYLVDEARNTVVETVIRAWEQYQVALATIKSSEDTATANEIALEGVTQEAEVGSRTTLDVLDAEQELFVARTDVIRARRNEIVAIHSLQSVIGKLNAETLALDTPIYNPNKHYNDVRFQTLGLGIQE